jgi:hypothetical protein
MKKIIFSLTLCMAMGIVFAQKNKKETAITFSDSIEQYLPTYQYQKPVFKGKQEIYEVVRNIENTNLPDSALNFNYAITASLNKTLDYRPEEVTVKLEKPGFRVQVYAGKDRDEAQRIRGMCLNMKFDDQAYLHYDRPNYRVKVGDFLTREDARELYRQLKKRFPEAIIVPDIVTVVKKATPDELIMLRKKEAEEKFKKGQK